MRSTESRGDWRARLSEVVGRLERVRPLGGNAWSVAAAGSMLVAKVGPGAHDEAAGLRLLRGVAGGPPVPEVVLAEDELVVTTAIEQVARTSTHDESFGHTLATLHTAPHTHWGGGSSWIGTCQVDASTRPDGATFYGARLHGSRRAADWRTRSSSSSPDCPYCCHRTPRPAARRPVVGQRALWCRRQSLVDRSVGPWRAPGGRPRHARPLRHRPGPPPDARTRRSRPLAPGWAERVALFQLYPLLVHTVLFGGSYRARAKGGSPVS